jgi:hypothetical protein
MCTYSLRSRGRPRPQGQACGRLMHARWLPEGFRPRRPRVACLCAWVQWFAPSLVLCLLTSVYQSVVTSWRPTRLTSECNHAQKGSLVPPNGLLYTTYGWMQGVRAASGRGRAASVRTVSSGTLPTLGRIAARLHIDDWLTLGPYKSGDIVVPHVVSLVRAGGGASRPCACTA